MQYDYLNTCSEGVGAASVLIKYQSEMSLLIADLETYGTQTSTTDADGNDTSDSDALSTTADTLANLMFNYGDGVADDATPDDQLTWQEWADVLYYQYEWDYPSDDEQTLTRNVLYDVAYGNSYCTTSSSYCTESELANCLTNKGECIWKAFDEYNATTNATTSTLYDGLTNSNGYKYLWARVRDHASTYGGYGYTTVHYLLYGWQSQWSFSLASGVSGDTSSNYGSRSYWESTLLSTTSYCNNYAQYYYYAYGMDYWYAVSCLHNAGGFTLFRDGYFKARANCDRTSSSSSLEA